MTSKTHGLTSQQTSIIVLVGIIGLLFGTVFFLANISISGQEFSPELFQERSFSYSRFPGTKIRMSSTSLSIPSSPCGKPILSTLPNSATTTWHVVKAVAGSQEERYAPSILLKYMESMDPNGNKFWDAWSANKPELASVAWPMIQQAALQDLYFCMPSMFDAMLTETNPVQLKRDLAKCCLVAALERAASKTGINAPAKDFPVWSRNFGAEWNGDPEIDDLISRLQN